MKRFAAALLVYACGGNEVPATSVQQAPPCDASPAFVEASTDAAIASDASAEAATAPDASAAAPVDPERVRDVLLATIASLPLKTIPSPPPPQRDPPRRPTHDLESRQIQVPLAFESSLRVSEGLPVEVIRRLLRQSMGRFRYCYENVLRTHFDEKGKLVMRFAIAHDGNVVLAEPLSSTMTPELATCITLAMRSMTFPQTQDVAFVAVEFGISFLP